MCQRRHRNMLQPDLTTASIRASAIPPGEIATREYAGYATDDWRILPNLTLTLGARYEYEYIPHPYPNTETPG